MDMSRLGRTGTANPRTHNRLVVGSIPTEPRSFALSNVSVCILDMLEALMGTDGKRKLRLRQKTSDELFALYHSQLVLGHQSQESLGAASHVYEQEAAPEADARPCAGTVARVQRPGQGAGRLLILCRGVGCCPFGGSAAASC